MKKYISILLMLALLAVALVACTSQEVSEETLSNKLSLPMIQENYWNLFDINCAVIYEPGFISLGSIDLTLLSSVPSLFTVCLVPW